MALVQLNVRRARPKTIGSAKNYSTEAWAVDDSTIKLAVPSLCKKDGAPDGLVNSKVTIVNGDEVTYLWVTDTVTTILALS